MEPLGSFTFDEAYEQFAAQVKGLKSAGPDAFIIETIADLNEMRAAILACKDLAPEIPLIAQMTIDPRGRSYTGTPPESAAIVMQSMGADVIGLGAIGHTGDGSSGQGARFGATQCGASPAGRGQDRVPHGASGVRFLWTNIGRSRGVHCRRMLRHNA